MMVLSSAGETRMIAEGITVASLRIEKNRDFAHKPLFHMALNLKVTIAYANHVWGGTLI